MNATCGLSDDAGGLADGRRLAEARRSVMAALMRRNPRTAVASTLAQVELAALPSGIRERCERRIATRAVAGSDMSQRSRNDALGVLRFGGTSMAPLRLVLP